MRIFTVKRVSEGFPSIKLKSVRTRSSRSRIAPALLAVGVLAAMAPLSTRSMAQDATTASSAVNTSQILCQPQAIGNRRIPKDSILARISSHQGDQYDPATVERDFNSLWNTGYFENVRIERADTPSCVQLVIYVLEKPTIRTIDYVGLNAVTLSDVQDLLVQALAHDGPTLIDVEVDRSWKPV